VQAVVLPGIELFAKQAASVLGAIAKMTDGVFQFNDPLRNASQVIPRGASEAQAKTTVPFTYPVDVLTTRSVTLAGDNPPASYSSSQGSSSTPSPTTGTQDLTATSLQQSHIKNTSYPAQAN
jgi:hypothetical protein